MTLTGELEPSYALVDKCAAMRDTGNLVWIHPSQCTKREQEIQQNLKEKSQILKVENMTLKMAAENDHQEAEHGSELKLMWCLQRRGLALDQADVMTWDRHELWVTTLFQSYASDPPPHFSKISLTQLVGADREMFTLLARECNGSEKTKTD